MVREAIACTTLAALLVGASVGVRWFVLDELHEDRRNSTKLDEGVLRSPGYDVLQIAAMEHQHAWADLFWLQVVQELGKPAEGAQASYDRLQRWSHIAVDLDPKYLTVYWASAINLIAFAKRANAAERLLLKGRQNLGFVWEFPFYIGYIDYFLRGDPVRASEWWQTAAVIPGAPRFLPSLAARALTHGGDDASAEQLLLTMMESLEGPSREDAELRLKVLRSEPTLNAYDEACVRFKLERGRRPVDGAELFREGFVQQEPFDQFREAITLDDDCRARTSIIVVRDDEAMKNVGKEGVSDEDEE